MSFGLGACTLAEIFVYFVAVSRVYLLRSIFVSSFVGPVASVLWGSCVLDGQPSACFDDRGGFCI